MLSVMHAHLSFDVPVVSFEITPYVLLKSQDNSVFNDYIVENDPGGSCSMIYKWYRIQADRKVNVCSIHPSKRATLQCTGCQKAKVPSAKSFHCTTECFSDAWQHHLVLHERASSAVNENGTKEEELLGRFNSSVTGAVITNSKSTLNNDSAPIYPSSISEKSGEILLEVGRSRTYTPTSDDIGHVLKFECIPVNSTTRLPVGSPRTVTTSRVIPAPSSPPRLMIKVGGADFLGNLLHDGQSASSGTFKILSYNILADQKATSDLYDYCPSWALSWPYRRQTLLKEIIGYHADIVCLQEVQIDHFEEFFSPELDKQGYQALYKRKTIEAYNGNSDIIDGCATFFRRDRFSLVKKYEFEFKKMAQRLIDAAIQPGQKKFILNRLIRDNIALIVVLEEKLSDDGIDSPSQRQLICVTNTHVDVHPDHKDAKLWQVNTLLKGLKKIASSADIPMLVCGDFDSLPGSASHALLAMGKVDQLHPDLGVDPLGILRPSNKLNHHLPLVSAYSTFARMVGVGPDLEWLRRVMDPTTNEPLFTKYTRDFIGTVDYIFYTADSLTVESLLELLDEDRLRKETALPSTLWSSDHIALLAEFRLKSRMRH